MTSELNAPNELNQKLHLNGEDGAGSSSQHLLLPRDDLDVASANREAHSKNKNETFPCKQYIQDSYYTKNEKGWLRSTGT